MQIIAFTATMMWKRAINLNSRLWLGGLLLVCLLIITPEERIPSQLVSFAVLLPAVFLLTDWNGSAARNGILAIITRGDSRKRVRTSEWLFPALAGAVVSSVTVFAVSAPPPWQFWVAASLIATSFSLIFLMTEQYLKYAGRTVLTLMWLTQLTGPRQTGQVTELLLFTGYPAAVLLTDPNIGSHHPDSYVLASLIVVFITAGIYTLLLRRNN
ncbi:MAG: hypothetical protein KAR40_13220 [Candidatus Sabulitectum sp.]|nr:hypothetical protein [Candidatus Sabulitectum sp.]